MGLFQVAIIGAGPAGIATAIQLKRYDVPVVVFEKNQPGGLLRNGFSIENYPGFPVPVPGIKLARLLQAQLTYAKVQVINSEVSDIIWNRESSLFEIKTGQSKTYSRTLVIASGTKAKRPEDYHLLPTVIKEKVHFEIFDQFGQKNRDYVIVGAGDAAFDYALSLAGSNRVTILNRGSRIRALPSLRYLVNSHKNISYHEQAEIRGITSEDKKLNIEYSGKKANHKIKTDDLVYAIGRQPDKGFYSSSLEKIETKLIDEGLIYLAGDVKNDNFRQAAIAGGDGIKTAMEIYFGLSSL